MKNNVFLFLAVLAIGVIFPSCAKDADLNDLTVELVGDYQGSFVDADLISTSTLIKVTRVSNTKVEISNPSDNLFTSWEASIIMPDDDTVTSSPTITGYAVSFILSPDPVTFGFTRNSGETFAGTKQ